MRMNEYLISIKLILIVITYIALYYAIPVVYLCLMKIEYKLKVY